MKHSGFQIMARLIGLVKPLTGYMILAITMGLIGHLCAAFITVFGFAVFYFTENLWSSLGYLFGIGVDSFSDIFAKSIIFDNLNLLIVGIIFAFPVIPAVTDFFKKRFKITYAVRRYVMTAVSIILILVSTVRMIGDTYSPFLYWNF